MLSMFVSLFKEEKMRVMLSIKERVDVSTRGHVELEDMVYGDELLLFKATSNELIYITHRREEITSPWSIPILTLYGSDRPLAVITLLDLLLKRLRVSFMNPWGILRRCIA